MKVIDLLNKIANGEEAPKKIKILSDNKVFEYNCDFDYIGENGDELFGECLANTMNIHIFLNDEVEIIEEDKKIEKLEIVNNGSVNAYALLDEYGTKCALTKHSKVMCDKINEIIDYLNKENK